MMISPLMRTFSIVTSSPVTSTSPEIERFLMVAPFCAKVPPLAALSAEAWATPTLPVHGPEGAVAGLLGVADCVVVRDDDRDVVEVFRSVFGLVVFDWSDLDVVCRSDLRSVVE